MFANSFLTAHAHWLALEPSHIVYFDRPIVHGRRGMHSRINIRNCLDLTKHVPSSNSPTGAVATSVDRPESSHTAVLVARFSKNPSRQVENEECLGSV